MSTGLKERPAASRRGRKRGYGRGLNSFFGKLVLLLALVAVCYFVIQYVVDEKSAAAEGRIHQLETELAEALKLGEKTEVTDLQIEEKLHEIGELATYSFEYKGEKTVTNTRQIMNWNIPGTTNRVDIKYEGIIKVGYDVDRIQFAADHESLKIVIILPEAEVLDNYIKLDGLECADKNNILNPIGTEAIISYFTEIENEELQHALEQGILEKAEENVQLIITNFLAAFPDYEVKFA